MVKEFFMVEKGLETRRLRRLGNLAANTMEIICNYKGVDLTIESLEFATNYKSCRVSFNTYKKDGEIDICDLVLGRDGSAMYMASPESVHTHESIIMYELIYDTTNNYYKFGLGFPLRFHNGVRITVKNPDLQNTHKVGCIVQLSIRG